MISLWFMCGFQGQAELNADDRTIMAFQAANEGKTECLDVIHASGGIHLDGSVSYAAATKGDLSCLRLAYLMGDDLDAHIACAAVVKGICEYLDLSCNGNTGTSGPYSLKVPSHNHN
jgi:hypothetical protein